MMFNSTPVWIVLPVVSKIRLVKVRVFNVLLERINHLAVRPHVFRAIMGKHSVCFLVQSLVLTVQKYLDLGQFNLHYRSLIVTTVLVHLEDRGSITVAKHACLDSTNSALGLKTVLLAPLGPIRTMAAV